VPRKLLIVALEPLSEGRLRAGLQRITDRRDVEAHVVSPASKVSRLQWLTNEEDDARRRAEAVADHTASAVEGDTVVVETETGDVDPLQATEDALRTFTADEIVVLCRPPERETWIERASLRDDGFERFGLPVSYVGIDG